MCQVWTIQNYTQNLGIFPKTEMEVSSNLGQNVWPWKLSFKYNFSIKKAWNQDDIKCNVKIQREILTTKCDWWIK